MKFFDEGLLQISSTNISKTKNKKRYIFLLKKYLEFQGKFKFKFSIFKKQTTCQTLTHIVKVKRVTLTYLKLTLNLKWDYLK